MTLIVAGHRPAHARQYLEDAFGSAPTGNRVPPIEPPTLTPIEKAQIFRFPVPRGEHQAPSASLYLSTVVPPDGSQDDSTVNILNAALNSHTRLPAALRFNSGISYGVKADVQCNLNAAVLTVRSHVDAARADEALTRIMGEFNRLQDDFVAEEQLDDIRYSVRYSAATALMSPLGKLNSMAYELQLGHSYQEYFNRLHAVTPQQIQDVAQAYLPRNLEDRHITSIWDPLHTG
jgi:predicted Zn-dependent peptidase